MTPAELDDKLFHTLWFADPEDKPTERQAKTIQDIRRVIQEVLDYTKPDYLMVDEKTHFNSYAYIKAYEEICADIKNRRRDLGL